MEVNHTSRQTRAVLQRSLSRKTKPMGPSDVSYTFPIGLSPVVNMFILYTNAQQIV